MYFVTTNTTFGGWFLDDAELAEVLGRIIREACDELGFRLYGYCILPNHIHLLVKKRGSHSLSRLMKMIKGRFWRHIGGPRFWQPRFNFRIIEGQTRFNNTVQYITFNYRKMSLPETYGQIPFVYFLKSAFDTINPQRGFETRAVGYQ